MIAMLKRIGVPLMALLGVLAVAPHQAQAGVTFGVYVGAPVYTYPVPVYPPPIPYYARPVYVRPAPAFVRAYRSWDRREDRWEHARHEWREHEGFGHDRR
jgi:hypothetical protein